MKNQSLIKGVFWLRSIACLAVTLGHAIHTGNLLYEESDMYHRAAYVLSMAVLFAVPVFVFISEFLLAHNYPKHVPAGFLKKRVRILLVPYLFMGTVYALINMDMWTFKSFMISEVSSIFLGKSAVYFILIIFQFYLLHMFFSKYLMRLPAKAVIPIAFLINFLYLAFFNFTEPPNNAIAHYIWNPGYWLPFIGWLFYFVLGFYCGKDYQAVRKLLRYKWLPAIPVFALVLTLFMNQHFLIAQDSKRVDMLIYASSVIFLIMYISSRVNQVPKVVMFVSNYSFSIFLLNMFYFVLLGTIEPPAFLNIMTYSLTVFLITLALSIGTAYVFNQFRFGKYLVGRIMSFKAKPEPEEQSTAYQHTADK
ncbi:Membrane-bound acyltransferase YfiQ, involved in biofilm formation [Lentibacillus persicus]|uniref:Membrane-bound acyltransferase YfiQ, involved in biofilm formation n=1 Tax=Lentibacillus persicus TaxID=640948 RepID=A0A1I1U8H1_9BACI|nr:acyltransferase family protein [Lentibacillus persicus]SFD66945.1 Membrane-bound acyltransferase YfiQ, involved in biofilm formation [Lentibacillus persicus]